MSGSMWSSRATPAGVSARAATTIARSSSSVLAPPLQRHQQHRDVGRVDAGQPRSLSQRGGGKAYKHLAGLVAQAAQAGVIDVRRQAARLHALHAIDLALLLDQVAAVFGL